MPLAPAIRAKSLFTPEKALAIEALEDNAEAFKRPSCALTFATALESSVKFAFAQN